jgi:hypothetical protein
LNALLAKNKLVEKKPRTYKKKTLPPPPVNDARAMMEEIAMLKNRVASLEALIHNNNNVTTFTRRFD